MATTSGARSKTASGGLVPSPSSQTAAVAVKESTVGGGVALTTTVADPVIFAWGAVTVQVGVLLSAMEKIV